MLTPEERMIGRRSFLKAMAALPAVGAFAWAAYVKRRHDRPLQVGIIGTGGEGRVLLEQAPVDLMQVKAVADIRPDSQQKAVEVIKKRWGAEPTIYADDYRQQYQEIDQAYQHRRDGFAGQQLAAAHGCHGKLLQRAQLALPHDCHRGDDHGDLIDDKGKQAGDGHELAVEVRVEAEDLL